LALFGRQKPVRRRPLYQQSRCRRPARRRDKHPTLSSRPALRVMLGLRKLADVGADVLEADKLAPRDEIGSSKGGTIKSGTIMNSAR
jgi:hypothetical protein